MKHYFFSRRPAQPEGGLFKIFDRKLDIRISSCDFKENAELIVDALNNMDFWKQNPVQQFVRNELPEGIKTGRIKESSDESASESSAALDHGFPA